MLSETQTQVLLGYAAIMNSSRPWSWVDRNDIRAAFVTRGFRSWYEVCVLPDYMGIIGDEWEAYGRGSTIQEAYEAALEQCRRHPLYLEFVEQFHEDMEFGGMYSPPEDPTPEPDVYTSEVPRNYWRDDIREFGEESRRFKKRYQRRYVRREVRAQLRAA